MVTKIGPTQPKRISLCEEILRTLTLARETTNKEMTSAMAEIGRVVKTKFFVMMDENRLIGKTTTLCCDI